MWRIVLVISTPLLEGAGMERAKWASWLAAATLTWGLSGTALHAAGPVETLEPVSVEAEAVQELHEIEARARALLEQGLGQAAHRIAREAMDECERSLGKDDPARVPVLVLSADVAMQQERYGAALVYLEEAVGIAESVAGNPQTERLNQLADECSLYAEVITSVERGEYLAAVPQAQEIVRLRRTRLSPDHADLAQALNDLGFLLEHSGDLDGAGELYQQALEVRLAVLPPEHPRLAESWLGLASLYGAQGRGAEAREAYDRALEVWNAGAGLAEGGPMVGYRQVVKVPVPQRQGSADGDRDPIGSSLRTFAPAWLVNSAGRRGQLFLRGYGGMMGGPGYLQYSVYYPDDDPLPDAASATDAELAVHARTGPAVGLGMGFGLSPTLELSVGGALRELVYGTSALGGEHEWYRVGVGGLQLSLGLRYSPVTHRRVAPLLGVSASSWHGPGTAGVWPDFESSLANAGPHTALGLGVQAGLEVRVHQRLDLYVEGALHRVLVWNMTVLEPAGDIDPSLAFHADGFNVAVAAGVQVRVGPFGGVERAGTR